MFGFNMVFLALTLAVFVEYGVFMAAACGHVILHQRADVAAPDLVRACQGPGISSFFASRPRVTRRMSVDTATQAA